MSIPPDRMQPGMQRPPSTLGPQAPATNLGPQSAPSGPGPQSAPSGPGPQANPSSPGPQTGAPSPGAQGAPEGMQDQGQDEQGFQLADPGARKMGLVAFENMLEYVYGDGWEQTIKELNDAPKKQLMETIGRMIATLYIIQETFARAAGKNLPQEIALDVGKDMVHEFFQILGSAGLLKGKSDTEVQQDMAKALTYAAKYYRMHLEAAGEFDQQGAMQLGEDIRSGKYDHVTQGPGTQMATGGSGVPMGPGGDVPSPPPQPLQPSTGTPQTQHQMGLLDRAKAAAGAGGH